MSHLETISLCFGQSSLFSGQPLLVDIDYKNNRQLFTSDLTDLIDRKSRATTIYKRAYVCIKKRYLFQHTTVHLIVLPIKKRNILLLKNFLIKIIQNQV